jgi:hypothetical protein
MDHPVELYVRRDAKEKEIDILYAQDKAASELQARSMKTLNKKLAEYQKWKEENKINGIRY